MRLEESGHNSHSCAVGSVTEWISHREVSGSPQTFRNWCTGPEYQEITRRNASCYTVQQLGSRGAAAVHSL